MSVTSPPHQMKYMLQTPSMTPSTKGTFIKWLQLVSVGSCFSLWPASMVVPDLGWFFSAGVMFSGFTGPSDSIKRFFLKKKKTYSIDSLGITSQSLHTLPASLYHLPQKNSPNQLKTKPTNKTLPCPSVVFNTS